MHFFILKENIDKILNIIGRNISIRPQLPILSNLLLKTENGKLTIATTDLELGLLFHTNAKIEKEGEITVPGKLLTEFVSLLPAGKIEFLLEGNMLQVKTNKTHASLATMPAGEFPSFPQINEIKNTFLFKKTQEAILRTVFAASTDEGRPVLTGLRITIADGRVTFAATDGYRLSMEQVEIPDKKENLTMILPAQSLSETIRIAQEMKSEDIGFSLIENKNQAVFVLPNVSVYTRLIEGEFPNVEKIIPSQAKTKVQTDRDQFIQAVKTTSLFARTAANIIKIKIEKDKLRLKAVTPQVGEDEDSIEAKVEGEETEIAFNYRFLLDLLSRFPEKTVVFETSGSLAPGVFKTNTNTSSFLHLIMPVRIQN
jgi:DNA polymerase-3 subunit beta